MHTGHRVAPQSRAVGGVSPAHEGPFVGQAQAVNRQRRGESQFRQPGRCIGHRTAVIETDPLARQAAAQAGATMSVSGFHDAKGRPEKNAALAKQRAHAVAVALRAAGVPDERIALKKPEQLNGGEAAEARRVEVAVAP